MSTENPTLSLYHKRLMWESHRLSFRTGADPEVLDHYLFTLCCSILDACEAGVSRDLIEKALTEGFYHGECQIVDSSLTPEYWQTVYQEIEHSADHDL